VEQRTETGDQGFDVLPPWFWGKPPKR